MIGATEAQILLVDDNPTNLRVLYQTLDGHGYRLLAARSGKDALAIAQRAVPDLVLLDVMMPEMDGFEVCRRLKSDPLTRHIPVVAVTAFAMKGDEERIREGGCEAYLSKPISVGKFIETVRHFLGTA